MFYFTYHTYCAYTDIFYLVYLWHLQSDFNPKDISFRTLRTMSDRLIKQMMPDEKVHKIDLHEGIITLLTS
jgi:hypothetical protein